MLGENSLILVDGVLQMMFWGFWLLIVLGVGVKFIKKLW